MHLDAGVVAGLVLGTLWLLIGVAVHVDGRRRGRRSDREGAGGSAVIGIFLEVVGVLTLLATGLLAVVPR